MVLSLSSDDDSDTEELVYPACASYSKMNKPYWTADKINDMMVLKHVDPMPGTYRCVFYIGTAFTYFSYHVEDEDIASVPYLFLSPSKVWYVIATSHRSNSEDFIAELVHAPERFNDFEGGTRQTLAIKNTDFDPMLLIEKDASFKVVRVLQPRGHFVIVAPRPYHRDSIPDIMLRRLKILLTILGLKLAVFN